MAFRAASARYSKVGRAVDEDERALLQQTG